MRSISVNIKQQATILTLVILSVFQLNCKKFVEIDLPPDRVLTASVFTSDSTASTAIAGLYSRMLQIPLSVSNGGLSVYLGLAADELVYTTPNMNYEPFGNNMLTGTTGILSSHFWVPAYSTLYHVNSMLEGLNKPVGISPALQKQLTGELKFIRAFYYFTLSNLFGDVPLILTTDYKVNVSVPRTAVTEIYQQVVSDLLDAQSLLSADFPSPQRVRPTKWAASALLARVYLYNQEYAKAETQATAVINSGAFNILTNTNEVFLGGSNETIWSLLPTNRNTPEATTFIPYATTIVPALVVSEMLVNAFEPNDYRKRDWLRSNTVNNNIYYYPYKYKITSNTPVIEHNLMLRYAEMFLIRSEARAQQNNIAGSLDDLNIIRNRAGLAGSAATDKESLLAALEQENRIEFFAEGGHRWFDLKRLNHINEILGPLKSPNWQPTDALFPLPSTEITLNPSLVQNPGY